MIPIKIYIYAAILLTVVGTTWSARGWYEDSQTKDALEQQAKDHNKQRAADLAQFQIDLAANVKTKVVYERIKEEIRNVPDTPDDECTVDVTYKRVWNSAISAIGESLTNSLHGALRTTLVHEDRQYELQSSSQGSSEASR